MNVRHGLFGCNSRDSMRHFMQNPMEGVDRMRQEELRQQYGGKNDPERPPPPGPGDIFIFIGLVVGMVIGIIAGIYLAAWTGNFLVLVLVAIGGAVLGTVAGSAIKKRYQKRRRNS